MSAISPAVNDLSMADAFRYYRDELGWHVHPVDGVWAKKDPGKKPSFSQWWNVNPHDCDVARMFNGSRSHNIGFAPRDKVVVVDLDSKADQGKSVEQFLAERGELTGTPWHWTRGGVHLVYRCRDLPQWKHANGRLYHDKLTNKGLAENVSAELFHSDHSNVVLPPSVHAVDGFVYRWGNLGELLEVSWQWLQQNYGFTGPQQPEKELPRWLEFEGDLHRLDLRRLLEFIGYPGSPIDKERCAILCPPPMPWPPWACAAAGNEEAQSKAAATRMGVRNVAVFIGCLVWLSLVDRTPTSPIRPNRAGQHRDLHRSTGPGCVSRQQEPRRRAPRRRYRKARARSRGRPGEPVCGHRTLTQMASLPTNRKPR